MTTVNAAQTRIFSRGFKRLILTLLTVSSLVGAYRIIESFEYPQIHDKDFLADYLMARAMVNGLDPYTPIPVLVEQLIKRKIETPLKHPSPHPPAAGLFALPFQFMEFESAVKLWVFCELLAIFATSWLITDIWSKGGNVKWAILFALFSIGWAPVLQSLWYAQLTPVLLLMLVAAWKAMRDGRCGWSGFWVGCAIALKLMAWPVALPFVIYRKWRGMFSVILVVLIANSLSMFLYSPATVVNYYLRIGPEAGSIYSSHDGNLSAWTWGKRLFTEFGLNFRTSPVWESEPLAAICTLLFPIILLIAGLWISHRHLKAEPAFGMLAGLSILLSPISWNHYLILSVIPMVILSKRNTRSDAPKKLAGLIFCCWFLMSFTHLGLAGLAREFATKLTSDGIPVVPFVIGSITLVPVVGLIWLLYLLIQAEMRVASEPPVTDGV